MKIRIVFAVLVGLILSLIITIGSAHDSVVVVPLNGEDAPEPATSKTVFLTSERLRGDLGGIAGADLICQTAADNSDRVTGIYRANLTDGITFPETDTAFKTHDLPYLNWDGTQVAVNFFALESFRFDNFPLDLDGRDLSAGSVSSLPAFWLGDLDTQVLGPNGIIVFTATCNGWTRSGGVNSIGELNEGLVYSLRPNMTATAVCGSTVRLMCLEQ